MWTWGLVQQMYPPDISLTFILAKESSNLSSENADVGLELPGPGKKEESSRVIELIQVTREPLKDHKKVNGAF